jgi:hypothetical protein
VSGFLVSPKPPRGEGGSRTVTAGEDRFRLWP